MVKISLGIVTKLPASFIQSLQNIKGFNQQSFEEVHASDKQVTSIRINPIKAFSIDAQTDDASPHPRFAIAEKVPWSSYGYYLSQRPSFTFDPLFHAGCYYVQDASSMFLEQALAQTVDLSKSLKVLDLCAAPGGKSTHIQSLLSSESLLVSNEVIKNRAGILKQNIIKWGCENVVVTNNDPQHFQKLESFFDVIVVDAPCSGSGLFRKDPETVEEWSEENVALCCGRQKRIIRDVLPALKEDGVLIYSTCSYSKEEDEDIADWLVQELNLQNEKLKINGAWGIITSESEKTASIGYRFFPDKLKGEGFFISCFRKTDGGSERKLKEARLEKASSKEQSILEPWIKKDGLIFLKEYFFYALPSAFLTDYSLIKQALNVQYAGIALGEIMKDKLIPDHALAQSRRVADAVAKQELDFEQAIKYLQRADFALDTENKGWQLVAFQQYNLGWINALPNRFNNYYPKELRILKQRDDAAFEK